MGYNGVRDYIMQMFYDFFSSEKVDEGLKQEIQGGVIDLLVKATHMLTSEDRTDKVLPIILESIRDDSDEERRILGLEMVDKLAELLGKEVCQSYLMYEIVSLQDDPVYRVRKETVVRMINISKVLGKDIFLRILFPVYKKLCTDQIWGVRRSAVEMLPSISMICPVEIKNGILIEIFKKFSQDQSKWVKMAAFQYLGPFIATYEGLQTNPLLIDTYISMLEQNKSAAPDNEVPFYCAFNFPAVLYTLGKQYWAKLRPLYETLIKDSRWKVRRTLSFSLHEVAKILGPELIEKELMHVLFLFMKDIEEVREGVTLNLPKFIEALPLDSREAFIDKLTQVQVDTKDWRKRILQAKQIKQFSKIFSAKTVYKHYVPVFFDLCQDQVSEVRMEGAKAVRNIILKLHSDPDLFSEFVAKVLLFKQSNKYNLRQTFVCMCGAMMNNKPAPWATISSKELFVALFLEPMIAIGKDRVVNVRMQLSECIGNSYKRFKDASIVHEIKQLKELVLRLKSDQSADVREPVFFIPHAVLAVSSSEREKEST